MAIYKLGEVCKYTTNKISSNNLNVSNYISTENMISNARGVTKATSVPFNTQLTKYDIGNILFSNIRPYFRKVWLATKAGGCSNDVLCFSPTVKIKSSYAFYILSSQPFIDYVVSTSKGTKMPRGDRSAIMNYLINIPSIREQEKIIEIIKPIEYLFLKYPSLVRIDTVQNCKNDVGDLIEIIKPLESLFSNLEKLKTQTLNFISNIPSNNKKLTLASISKIENEKPKGIQQVSAKVMKKRDPSIYMFEEHETYKSNNFFAPSGTLLINTIRPNLNKFCILPANADYNGTNLAVKVNSNQTALIKALVNNNFWEQCVMLTKGTKMPIISKTDLLNSVIFEKVQVEIPNIFYFFQKLGFLSIKIETIKNKLISLLIK